MCSKIHSIFCTPAPIHLRHSPHSADLLHTDPRMKDEIPNWTGGGCRYEFPTQEELFDVDDSFMVGPALLLAPVTHEGQTSRNVTLPAGSVWYRAATGELEVSAGEKVVRRDVAVTLDDVPAYLRGGTIIPTRQRTRRSTAAAASVAPSPLPNIDRQNRSPKDCIFLLSKGCTK
jgi:hypothetical protein